MISKISKRWVVTIILAGILIALAELGGTWGETYAAPSETTTAPQIASIDPVKMMAVNENIPMIIKGSNFGPLDKTRVRFYQWGGPVYEIAPVAVYPRLILVEVSASMVNHPAKYNVEVEVYSSVPTVPTLPAIPGESSNQVVFSVYTQIFVPIVSQ